MQAPQAAGPRATPHCLHPRRRTLAWPAQRADFPTLLAQGRGYPYGTEPDEDEASQYLYFTQLLWRSTKRVGCTAAQCTADVYGTQFPALSVVCRYDPPGNIAGQYAANLRLR